MDARYVAAKVLTEVIASHKHLDTALDDHLSALDNPRERRLAGEICYGVMRWHPRLAFITELLLNKPIRSKDTDILASIYSGLYQLMFLRIPDHAAISATVETANELKKPWARVLINAVLRRYQREQTEITRKINETETALYAHPQWLLATLRKQWPNHWQAILDANNEHPPLQLRVNIHKQQREDYLQQLQLAGIEAHAGKIVSTGVSLVRPMNVEDIPGFQTGTVSVQDYGAQIAAVLLDARAGERILDACAAPGGKTGHILERTPGIQELLAVESNPERIARLKNTLCRLGINATVINADINNTDGWWNGIQFDRILLDAPCSGTGVIRRHPDIKYLRSPDQTGPLANTQRKMLDSLWPLLKPGGRLVYSTCSILIEEGEGQIETFLDKYDDAVPAPVICEGGLKTQYGLQTLPGYDETDGFYYSVIGKKS